jgi:hypothetical protein
MTATDDSPLIFAHLGDLHLTDSRQRNYRDLLSIVARIETECAEHLDFLVLPGDNAENGQPDQYALASVALRMLSVPVHAIPGDHDMEQGSLAAFHEHFAPLPLPRSVRCRGHRLLFLDCCGRGKGGPDFRLGAEQLAWVETELKAATARTETPAVFMHTYPADLRRDGEAEALTRLFSSHRVAFVDMGHTHYNEIANDGTTVYSATRSTGQIDEGPVGYGLATIDKGIVGWRFRALDDPFPIVMITAPADYRLLRGADQKVDGQCEVRASVLGREPAVRVECQVADSGWTPMRRPAGRNHWIASVTVPAAERITITVRAITGSGRPATHSVTAAGRTYAPPPRCASGSDAASIGAWPGNGILGTQLGPNRNGRKW